MAARPQLAHTSVLTTFPSLPRSRMAANPVPDILAAVDLGSNSFHMVVARYFHGQIVIMDRLREMVRLGAGVEENGRIDKDVAARNVLTLQYK